MSFRALSKCDRSPVALRITGVSRHDIASCQVVHTQARSATVWPPRNRKQQRSMSSLMYGSFSASSSTSAFNKLADFCPASDENESSTEFPNGRAESISKCVQNFGGEQSRFCKQFSALTLGWWMQLRSNRSPCFREQGNLQGISQKFGLPAKFRVQLGSSVSYLRHNSLYNRTGNSWGATGHFWLRLRHEQGIK
jgi:hypothetical protein